MLRGFLVVAEDGGRCERGKECVRSNTRVDTRLSVPPVAQACSPSPTVSLHPK